MAKKETKQEVIKKTFGEWEEEYKEKDDLMVENSIPSEEPEAMPVSEPVEVNTSIPAPIETPAPIPASPNGSKPPITKEDIQKWEAIDNNKNIPGRGHLFHVRKEHLPESTRLNEREIVAFAIGDVQQAVLDHNRTESVFDIFKHNIMQYKISFEGQGRKESIILHQLTTEEKTAALKGSMFGIDDVRG